MKCPMKQSMRGVLIGTALSLVLGVGSASAQSADKPQYGGTLEIGTVYVMVRPSK